MEFSGFRMIVETLWRNKLEIVKERQELSLRVENRDISDDDRIVNDVVIRLTCF